MTLGVQRFSGEHPVNNAQRLSTLYRNSENSYHSWLFSVLVDNLTPTHTFSHKFNYVLDIVNTCNAIVLWYCNTMKM